MPAAADAAIEYAVHLLKQGRLVAFPTETVYGLGADASNPDAVKRIFTAKGRPAKNPVIVHIAHYTGLNTWAENVPEPALQLAKRFWPGPLTIVLQKRPEVPLVVTGGQNTVALRVPKHPVALRLLDAFDGGIAAPSANRYCRISPTEAKHVIDELGRKVDLILDGGKCEVGLESTIVDFSGDVPRLLRPGHISQFEIEDLIKCYLYGPNTEADAVRAPGMSPLHYAPVTIALRCPAANLNAAVQLLTGGGKRIGIMTYQSTMSSGNRVRVIRMPRQVDQYAQVLYSSLRQLDALNLDRILVEQPPETAAWSAVNDRLRKATTLV